MPIPASFIVSVVPRLISPGGRDLEFNGLFLTQSAIIPYPQMVETFTSADAVAKYFGMQETRVGSHVQEDPACLGAAKPVYHSY